MSPCPICGSDNVFVKVDTRGRRWVLRCFEEDREFSPPHLMMEYAMFYCEFIKCWYGDTREDLGGCSVAWSGETCHSLYYPEKNENFPKFIAYEIHLEEVRLNNE